MGRAGARWQAAVVTPDRGAAAPALAPATRRRDLGLLLAGTAVSTVGGSLALLAVMVHLEPSGPGWIAAAWAGELLPVVLLAPVVGRVVDRVRNRELLLGAITLQALALTICGLLGVRAGGEVVIIGSLVLLGVGTAVANPVIAALLPRVSGEEHATRAYGWFSMISQAGFLAGFAVAGVLVDATSERTALLIAGGASLAMAAAVAFIRTQRVPEPDADRSGGSMWLGFARIRADGFLLVGVTGLGVATLIAVLVNIADVFYVLDEIGASATAYGLVTALWPAAGVVGGWYAGRLVGDRLLARWLAWTTVAVGVALLVASSVVSIVAVGVGWLIGGAANTAQRVCLNALVRSRTDDAARGRVFSAVSGVLQAGNLVGLVTGATFVALIGARASMAWAGAATVVVGLLMLAARAGGPSPAEVREA
jgi:predicted MFS family arabinose efflux permease